MELRGAAAHIQNCNDGEILIEGRAGTGKTIGILTKLYHALLTYAGCRILVCRQTRESCTESWMTTWEEKILGAMHPLVVNGAARANRDDYTFPNRSSLVVGGLDMPAKLFSTEWDMIYVNEATDISLDAWELFGRAMRNRMMPYQQRIADCNPNAPSHWLNKRATTCPDTLRMAKSVGEYRTLQDFNGGPQPGSKMRRLVSVHLDNPAYFDKEKWDYTLFGHHYLTNELGNMTGHRRSRMLDGLWVAAEGTVFPEFNEAKHVIDDIPANVIRSWPHFLGYDPGYDHPTAVLWWAIAPNGCYYVVDEIYEGGKSVKEHGAEIMRRNREKPRNMLRYFGDPQHAFSETAQAPIPIAQQFKDATGINMSPWPRSTDKEAMVNNVRQLLNADPVRLKVFRSCRNTINEFQSWRFKRTAKGELPAGDDAYVDADNHAMDVICGLASMNLTGSHTIRVVGG